MKKSLCTRPERGFTLVELLVVIAVVTILYLLIFAGASFGNAKQRALRVQCENNLKFTGAAFDMWAKDHGEKFPMEISQTNGGTMEFDSGPNEWRHFQVISNELSTPKVLFCLAETDRARLAAICFDSNLNFYGNPELLSNSNLSYFINLDYSHPNPSAIWSGDRNVTNASPIHNGILELTTNQPAGWTAEIHHKVGNLLLFDGSVQQADRTGLRSAIANSGVFTNRLQMPILGP